MGLLGLGVGFLATSVWFWQTAGFSFATVFARKFLAADADADGDVDAGASASTDRPKVGHG